MFWKTRPLPFVGTTCAHFPPLFQSSQVQPESLKQLYSSALLSIQVLFPKRAGRNGRLLNETQRVFSPKTERRNRSILISSASSWTFNPSWKLLASRRNKGKVLRRNYKKCGGCEIGNYSDLSIISPIDFASLWLPARLKATEVRMRKWCLTLCIYDIRSGI